MLSSALRAFCLLAMLPAMVVLPNGHGRASAAMFVGPKAYYLALGDSLGYGYQPNGTYNQGYADDFYANLKSHGTTSFTNMACPGETASTFINGGCPYWYIRKTVYFGSQLSAALSFIKGHAGKVSPVTIDIGANDVKSGLSISNCTSSSPVSCTCTIASNWQSTLSAFDTNFSSILAQLQSALAGKGDLVAMNYYNPYQNECAGNPAVMSQMETFNQHIAQDAAANNVSVADVFSTFETFDASNNPITPDPYLCGDNGYPDFTWMCSSYHDIHATAAGYSTIASDFEATTGY